MKIIFLQIGICENDRDCLGFHWVVNKYPSLIQILYFIPAVFGLIQSLFLLLTIKGHLKSKRGKFHKQTKKIKQIKKILYVDDFIIGFCTIKELSQVLVISISTFQDAGL